MPLVSGLNLAKQEEIRDALIDILERFGRAIEFWSVACLAQSDLGHPRKVINDQWESILARIQQLRHRLSDADFISPAVHEQISKLQKTADDLLDVFGVLMDFKKVPMQELESATLKLQGVWADARQRITFLGAILPLRGSLPNLSLEQERYYRQLLDSLFDRFVSSTAASMQW
jgi:hypothetical protein